MARKFSFSTILKFVLLAALLQISLADQLNEDHELIEEADESSEVDGRWGGGHGHHHHHHGGHRPSHYHSKPSKSSGGYSHKGSISKGHGGYNNKPHRPIHSGGGYGGHHQVQHRPEIIESGYGGGDHHQVQHRPAKGLGAGGYGHQQPSYPSQPHGVNVISDHRRPHIGGPDAHGLGHPGGPQGPQYGGSFGGIGASQVYQHRPDFGSPIPVVRPGSSHNGGSLGFGGNGEVLGHQGGFQQQPLFDGLYEL